MSGNFFSFIWIQLAHSLCISSLKKIYFLKTYIICCHKICPRLSFLTKCVIQRLLLSAISIGRSFFFQLISFSLYASVLFSVLLDFYLIKCIFNLFFYNNIITKKSISDLNVPRNSHFNLLRNSLKNLLKHCFMSLIVLLVGS